MKLGLSFGKLILIAFLSGCGAASVTSNEVTDLSAFPTSIEVGERSQLIMNFTIKSDLLGRSADQLEVVVFIPNGLSYVERSSKLVDRSSRELIDREPNRISECGANGVYLIYRFDDKELEETGVEGEYEVRFDVSGRSPGANQAILAAASEDQLFGCESGIAEEKSVTLSVSG